MEELVINHQAADGKLLKATFLPSKGMNMVSFKKGDVEVIDQSTRALFEERFAGLGALIGPHFHRRNPAVLPKIADETLFPHIARVKAKGVADPFSHGIARYAPWKVESDESSFKATLNGKDQWNGVPLSTLEGQNFTMHFKGRMSEKGLHLALDVVSDTDSLVGIHYYYHLPKGKGKVISSVQPWYIGEGVKKEIPPEFSRDFQGLVSFDLAHEADYTFYPYPDPRVATITLDAIDYQLVTQYRAISQENCWQLYHPKGASYVCIEPISSQDPRHPNLTVSSIEIDLSII